MLQSYMKQKEMKPKMTDFKIITTKKNLLEVLAKLLVLTLKLDTVINFH